MWANKIQIQQAVMCWQGSLNDCSFLTLDFIAFLKSPHESSICAFYIYNSSNTRISQENSFSEKKYSVL
jgi:hypothetical protein